MKGPTGSAAHDGPACRTRERWDGSWLVRGPLARHLVGRGLDLGPGHQPFPSPYPGIRTWLVDRWRPEENLRLFPELEGSAFPEPDVLCDLARSSLDSFRSASMDFVVASHVIEHVPNPLRLLDGIHRVLRPGGVAILLVPDRRRTFDIGRPPTTLGHVVADFERGVTTVDDDHISEVMANDGIDVGSLSEAERDGAFARHRARSIHVHCWAPAEFNELLAYSIAELHHQWDLVEAVLAREEAPEDIEFGYVLRKSEVELGSESRCDRFRACWTDSSAHRGRLLASAARSAVVSGASGPDPGDAGFRFPEDSEDVAVPQDVGTVEDVSSRRPLPLPDALKRRFRGKRTHALYDAFRERMAQRERKLRG